MPKPYTLRLNNGQVREGSKHKFVKSESMIESRMNATRANTDDVFRAEPSKNAVKKDLKVLFKEQSTKPPTILSSSTKDESQVSMKAEEEPKQEMKAEAGEKRKIPEGGNKTSIKMPDVKSVKHESQPQDTEQSISSAVKHLDLYSKDEEDSIDYDNIEMEILKEENNELHVKEEKMSMSSHQDEKVSLVKIEAETKKEKP